MMRAAVAASRSLAVATRRPVISAQRSGASYPRMLTNSTRNSANERKPDETVLPIANAATAPAAPTLPVGENIPKTPPTPSQAEVGTAAATVAGKVVTPKPRRRRRGRAFFYLIALLGFSYAGGVYYALVNDNFHDFFTEYVPLGEEAVLFFEEREFRKRFPEGRPTGKSLYPQTSGEPKVTVAKRSGVSATVASDGQSAGRSSSTEAAVTSSARAVASKAKDAADGVKEKTKDAVAGATRQAKDTVKTVETKVASIKPIDNLQVDNATDPFVQQISKMLNDIITVVNADGAASKYEAAIEKSKESIQKLGAEIASFRQVSLQAADEQKRKDQAEFDAGAKELLRRIQQEQQDQELRFREEWEAEREKLASSYQTKLHAEVEALARVADQRLQNELLEQATKLRNEFASSIRDRVETERAGRLSKLNDLSTSVAELEKLTSDWTSVLNENLKTQHLVVAVDAVRSIVEDADQSKPFIHELAALKEISADDPVVDAAIGSIKTSAYQRGLPTPAQLIDRFRRVATEVRKASLLPEDAGAASHAASLVLSKVMFKKQGLATGDDVESILTRTETLLEEGNLDEAAREVNGLQGWAKVLSRDWLAECRTVLEARQALEVIATQAKLQSLLVE